MKKDAAKEAKDPATLAAKRKEIETENKRKQDEYESKVAAGKKHAKELGDRFAQWYYVIPGQTYAKIHLDRGAIVKKKSRPRTPPATTTTMSTRAPPRCPSVPPPHSIS